MAGKMLFTASTYSHILNFHLPYLHYFQNQGWTIHVACGGPPALIPYADETSELPFVKSMWSPKNLEATRLLHEKLKRERYTLISTHTSLASFFTRLALSGLEQRPVVANMVHGYLFDDKTPWLKRRTLLAAEQWMASRTDLVLTMNQWDFETAKRFRLGEKVTQIPGVGVDFAKLDLGSGASRRELREMWGIPAEAFVLIYAAEFSKRKSQEILIRAITRLPEEVMLVLPGDGVLRPACQVLAERLGVRSRVLFPGYQTDMGPWYGAADAAASASRSEGLPFHIMEAMYAGLPVVASAVKGHIDLIRNEENGLLYTYGDTEGCAKQIRRLAESDALRRRVAERARVDVEQFGLERVFPVVLAQYGDNFPNCVNLQSGVE